MKELSLNLLDIAENSVTAGASLVIIRLTEDPDRLIFSVADNGSGMTEEFVARVTDPFTTTRTTRKVGMGIPLLKMAAEQSGGGFTIQSRVGVGTTTTAWFDPRNIDTPPLGDVADSILTLIQGSPDIDFLFTHRCGQTDYTLDTREVRSILPDIPLNTPELLSWLSDFLNENENELKKGRSAT